MRFGKSWGYKNNIELDGKIYLPNNDISFANSLVYNQDQPFTGTLRGYNIENNPECPDEITVDFVNGQIQGRAQAITLEDIDVLYQINDSKLDGWSVVFVYQILYQNDKPIECKLTQFGKSLGAESDCSKLLTVAPSRSSITSTGDSVTNTFYNLLHQINQSNFSRSDLGYRCLEVYKSGQEALL